MFCPPALSVFPTPKQKHTASSSSHTYPSLLFSSPPAKEKDNKQTQPNILSYLYDTRSD